MSINELLDYPIDWALVLDLLDRFATGVLVAAGCLLGVLGLAALVIVVRGGRTR